MLSTPLTFFFLISDAVERPSGILSRAVGRRGKYEGLGKEDGEGEHRGRKGPLLYFGVKRGRGKSEREREREREREQRERERRVGQEEVMPE